MEVRESLYMHEIEPPDDSHRKKIEHVKERILAMKERTKILRAVRSGFLVLKSS